MISSLKKLALSLVVASSVTTVGFANPNGSGIFEREILSDSFVGKQTSSLENITKDIFISEDNTDTTYTKNSFDVSTLFETKKTKTVERNDLFPTQKVLTASSLEDSSSFLPAHTEQETVTDLEATLFNSAVMQKNAETVRLEQAKLKQAIEDKEHAERLAEQNIEAQKLYENFMAQRNAPSNFKVFGDYAYSAGKLALYIADYAARSLPGAYFATYMGIELLEIGVSYAGYVTAAGLTTWYSGGNIGAGQAAGNAAYLAIETGFNFCHKFFPGLEYVAAAFVARDVKPVINFTLDRAPAVVDTATSMASSAMSMASSAMSYFRSYWS